jgi:hypothetical protein
MNAIDTPARSDPDVVARSSELAYLRQDCPLTIQQALQEYHQALPFLLDERNLSGQARELFHNHDLAHVVFGCDTSIRQEALIDTWTIFGSDVGFSAYLDYLRVPEAKNVVTEAGLGHVVWEFVKALPDVVRVIVRARRMRKRWPWRDHDAYLDRAVADVRRELGIEVLAHP